MNFTINSTLTEILNGAGGILVPVNPAEKKEGSPDYRGAIERQVKDEQGNYKTVARLEVSGWNAESRDKTKRFISLSVCGGLLRGALFKNDDPKGNNPPDASGTLGEKETGTLMIAARKTTFSSGGSGLRLSVYQAQSRSGDGGAPDSAPHGQPSGPDDYPF